MEKMWMRNCAGWDWVTCMLQPLSLEMGSMDQNAARVEMGWVLVKIGGLSYGPWYERKVRCILDS